MGLVIQNVSGATVDIDDLGFGLVAGGTIDLVFEADAVQVASSGSGGDLQTLISAGTVVVKDPLDNVTNLSIADGLTAVRTHNETHYRMPAGGRIGDISDVDLTGLLSGQVITFNGSNWTPVTPTSTANVFSTVAVPAGGSLVADNTADTLTIAQPASGITITGTPATDTMTFALANDLLALENLATTGFAVRTATDTWVSRAIAGTTNQITITNGDGVAGNPAASIPTQFIIPGSIQVTTRIHESITSGVTAAGTTSATATAISGRFNVVTTVAAGTGVRLPVPTSPFGRSRTVMNRGANPLNVYPQSGGNIANAAANIPIVVPVGQEITFVSQTATQHWVLEPVIAAGTGITITPTAGTLTITSTVGSGSAEKVMNTWTLLSGNLYYNDFTHNLNTTRVTMFLRDTATNQEVRGEYMQIINANTVRLVVNGNGENITMNVVSGTGPAGPAGVAGAGMISGISKNDGANVNAAPRSVLNFIEGSGITLTITDDAGGDEVDITVASSASAITVQDEGTPLATSATTLNFVGAGVTATGTGATKTVTIPGSVYTPPTTNLTVSGRTVSATVDTNATGFGGTLYMAADGNFDGAGGASGSVTWPCRALATEAGTGVRTVLLEGFIRNNAWTWTPGTCVYISVTTGLMTQTPPTGAGQKVQKIGFAWSATTVYFSPGDYTMVEVA